MYNDVIESIVVPLLMISSAIKKLCHCTIALQKYMAKWPPWCTISRHYKKTLTAGADGETSLQVGLTVYYCIPYTMQTQVSFLFPNVGECVHYASKFSPDPKGFRGYAQTLNVHSFKTSGCCNALLH